MSFPLKPCHALACTLPSPPSTPMTWPVIQPWAPSSSQQMAEATSAAANATRWFSAADAFATASFCVSPPRQPGKVNPGATQFTRT